MLEESRVRKALAPPPNLTGMIKKRGENVMMLGRELLADQ